ncbi:MULTISPECIES: CYTH and CHAD domain-containing protein [unclassified Methylobacterium]|uniref:CYTH and CHAD domain-containing protein n=1 Tax=unclassified Methylobacterium TaxID=2615210 RepID=UPI0006FD61DF|nr:MULTISPECIES: CYTH and CHAD domain-containing protein [unclassified Methylobacterium]KQO54414.1 metal-chelation protein CHAD [Methylobacterium sp. Leaf86]KQO90393.1 metal-chelation protein CHAD [Methylobacterium sp. Leaf91]
MVTPREIELKLDCGAAELLELARHPLLAVEGPTDPEFLSATYYDTAERALHRQGITLRVRRHGERHVQTVKAASSAAGLFDRSEWEWAVDGPTPDLSLIDDTPVPDVLGSASAPDLNAVVTTVIERSTRAVAHGTSRISATLDQGRVETPDGDAPIWELELELIDGDPADLFSLAQTLAETVPLRLGVLSKSERGFRILSGTLRRPSKAGSVKLSPDGSAAEAFRAIAIACLTHLRLNEDVFLKTRDPEGLHQIRVALRRLRSAFTLFKPILASDPAATHLRQEIKRVTEPFGHARNLDVFLSETLAGEMTRRPDEAGLDDLRIRLEAERDRAYGTVFAILESQAWRSLILDLSAWIETGPWRGDGKREPVSARDHAEATLDKARRRIRKRGRHLHRIDAEARHEVRIEAKKLRYGAEFFASLYAEKSAQKRHKAFVSALSDLQDHLGALNDLATAHSVLASLADTGNGETSGVDGRALFAAGLTAADGEARTGQLLKAAEKAHEALLDVKPFWR